MNKIITSIFLSIFFSACTNSSDWIGLSQEIISDFSNKKKNDYFFELFATGFGGSDTSQLKLFCMTYHCNVKMTIDLARIFLVQYCEEFLLEVNENEKIRPWLYDYPCTNENLDVIFAFYETHYTKFPAPYVSIIILGKGKIYYDTSDENGNYVDLHEETYAEALQIYHEYMKSKNINQDPL